MSMLEQRLSANISFLFTELPFLDRLSAAVDAGFTCVEFLFPYDHAPETVARRLEANQLDLSVFNAPPGDWDNGERGLAALPDRKDEFRQTIRQALVYGGAMNAERMHVMAGVAPSNDQAAAQTYRENLDWASDIASDQGIQLMIEPINTDDMPGYFLDDFALAAAIISASAGRIGLQFDIYHCHKIHASVLPQLETYLPITTHIQIAGVPDRHEPASPALPLGSIFGLLDGNGYAGRVGCEYRPATDTVEGLAWVAQLESER
ncbi:MAG: TIM barrel protein [Sphingomonas sp.]|nr:TIM barrel protein [Sphingomonas sp.]